MGGGNPYIIGSAHREHNLRVHVGGLEGACLMARDRSEDGGDEVQAGYQGGCVHKCVLEVGVTCQELGVKERGILDIPEEGSVHSVRGRDMLEGYRFEAHSFFWLRVYIRSTQLFFFFRRLILVRC